MANKIKESKEELQNALRVALSKIMVLKRKNRRLNEEVKQLQEKYDDLLYDYRAMSSGE